MNKKSKTILISTVFAGDYGTNKNNLPHEVINFYKPDEGNYFYAYINYNGIVKEELEGVIFVRTAGNGFVEILGKAEGNITILKNEELKDTQKNVTYGGVSIKELYFDNNDDYGTLVSIKCDKICLPKKTYYITTDRNKYNTDIRKQDTFLVEAYSEKGKPKKLNPESMRTYFYSNEESYKTLENILANNDIWKSENDTLTYDENSIIDDKSFFKITRNQDDEVTFSNTLYYFLSEYEDFRTKFIKDVLNVSVTDCINVIVEREKNKMDISIKWLSKNQSKKFEKYIIIENKIHSDINGTSTNNVSDKEKMKGIFNCKELDNYKCKEINGKNKIISQLSKYYELAKSETNEPDKNIHAFVIAPVYANFSLVKEQYLYGEKYNYDINYKTISDFLEKYLKVQNELDLKDKFYMNDFLIALRKHTKNVDDEFRNDMLLKLKNRINSIKIRNKNVA